MRIFVTGSTGLVGRMLVPQLLNRNDEVVCVTRNPQHARSVLPAQVELVGADPTMPGTWQDRMLTCDAVVNLAGEPVATGRWTRQKKNRIRRSRLAVTGNIASALGDSGRAMSLVSASAVGFYGNRDGAALGEDEQPGQDFLARLAVEWEHTASEAARENVRVVLLRIGVVLSAEGGALAQMVPAFNWGLGGPLGSGRQYFPWIHVQDLVRIILFSLDNESISGPLNAVVPIAVMQREFASALAGALGKRSWLAAPRPALKLILGEKADMILGSQRAVPNVLKASGFRFTFGELDKALRDLFPLGPEAS